jgi:hypothetical protein
MGWAEKETQWLKEQREMMFLDSATRLLKPDGEMKMPVTKEKVLFYLNRCVKQAQTRAEFNQEAAATRGMDYATRQRMTADADEAKPEAEALEKAYTVIMEQPDF